MAELELDQPVVVTMDDLAAILERTGSRTPTHVAAQRLRQRGWLLPTGTPGVWEFAPGAHAGPVGHGDPFLPLRAALAQRDGVPGATVALLSALWAQGIAPRAPDRLEVAVPAEVTAPAGLRRSARVVRFTGALDPVEVSGVPAGAPETVLVHAAARPADVRSWGLFAELLPDLVAGADRDKLRTELAGRPAAVWARLGYLIHALDPDFASELAVGRGKVWFGPRGRLPRHNARFDVADTLLPFDPADLVPAGGDAR